MRKFLILAAVAVTGFVWSSCGKTDSPGQTDSLTVSITADKTSLEVNQTVTFTVKTNAGSDVSGSATYYVDGVAISGRTFSSPTAGTFSVKAKYDGKETGSVQVTFTATSSPITSITLSASKTSAYLGETVSFTVTGNNGANLTAQSVIYVNGAAQTGSTITTNNVGTYAVKAVYNSIESAVVQVTFSEPPITSLTITASQTTLFTGGTTTFTVMANTGANVTAASTISVNGSPITGNSFTTNTAGTYNVKATYNTIESNTIQVVFNTPVTAITLAASATNVTNGTPVNLTVTTNTSVNVTAQSKIYVNGVEQAAGTTSYTPQVSGTYNVYATYVGTGGNTLTSNTVQITSNPGSIINFNKRVLIEDFTGTWCGWCTRVSYAIELVKAQTTDAVIAAIHRGSDPYNFPGASVLESQIGLTGYPTAQLNRTTRWTYPEPNNVPQVIGLTTGVNPRLGLAMTSTATGNDVSLTVKVKFGDDFSNLRLVVYALEDGLIYNQTNYNTGANGTPVYYGGANPVVGFVHDNVLRAVLSSSILGENITGTTNSGSEYTKTFNYTVPATYQFSKMHFVAFVVNSSNTTINSRDAKINENQAYEIE